MRPVLKNRAGVPPLDILQEILSTDNSIGRTPSQADTGAPYITWLADSDARVQPEMILPRPTSKIFSVRNLANQLSSSLSAVDYGINFLHSPVLLITGNTDSEMIRLFINGYEELDQTISQELNHLYPPLIVRKAASENKETPLEKERRLVEQNVDYQVEQAIRRYKKRIDKHRLVVVGSVLDIANLYGKGAGQLLLININGETNPEKLRKMPMLRTLDPKLLVNVGRMGGKKDKQLKKSR